jgi:hypothetical protein
VKEVVERQARSQRGLLDQALQERRRKDALAELGELIVTRAQRGELGELVLDPEVGAALAAIDELDDQADDGFFDAAAGGWEQRIQAPPSARRDGGAEAVSSAAYRPPPAPASEGEYRVWRPVMPEDDPVDPEAVEPPAPEAKRASRAPLRRPRRTASRSGGAIHFVEEEPRPGDLDSDDDLESYMHDDDVPGDRE